MGSILRFLLSLFLVIGVFNSISQAEDPEEISVMMDEFYDDLADIIERNMDAPDRCVREVDDYYRDNWETVERIRELTTKAMEEAMAMMQQFESTSGEYSEQEYMTPEELEEMAKKKGMAMQEPPAEHETDRYAEALEEFTTKYPKHGLEIVMKAMVFIPGVKLDE